VAAVANNNKCIVGVAHNSTLIGGEFVFTECFFNTKKKMKSTSKLTQFILPEQESNY
jgi:hypothetical protein